MIFITSGQYLKIEIQNEIGALPPCFSFLQNKRLYEFQVELLRNSWPLEKIILTLPKDFEIPQYDKNRLEELEIEMLEDGGAEIDLNPNQNVVSTASIIPLSSSMLMTSKPW